MKYVTTPDELSIGATVKVRQDCRCSAEMRGMTGTVLAGYGHPGYAAFDVLLEDGRSELFWRYELTEVGERAVPAGSREV